MLAAELGYCKLMLAKIATHGARRAHWPAAAIRLFDRALRIDNRRRVLRGTGPTVRSLAGDALLLLERPRHAALATSATVLLTLSGEINFGFSRFFINLSWSFTLAELRCSV